MIDRAVLKWLNEYPNFPPGVKMINYDDLPTDTPGIGFITIQGNPVIKQYNFGEYLGQAEFKIVYRGQPGDSNNDRLKMAETVDEIAKWACLRGNLPDLGFGIKAHKVKKDSRGGMFAQYQNGDYDYQILMTLIYDAERS